MSSPLVSLNLLLFKPGFYLKSCLDSILSQNFQDFELIIIDNNSSDGTVEQVKKIIVEEEAAGRFLSFWRIIENKENFGFAAGHNRGIKESRGKLVFLLNQDIILDTDFVGTLVRGFKLDEEIGSIQAKILRLKVYGDLLEKTKIIDNTGLAILKNRRIIARGQGQPDGVQFDRTGEVFGVDGAASVYRREALEDIKTCFEGEVEYFDEDFFMYKEDVDLAWRLRLRGWKAVYEPKAVAWHARTAGDSAARNYLGIIKERLKINKLAKFYSFRNQRLMQIKNEDPWLLFLHLPWFLPKEIASWIYVLFFERYSWKAIVDLFKKAPVAWQKRKIIAARKKSTTKEISQWFM